MPFTPYPYHVLATKHDTLRSIYAVANGRIAFFFFNGWVKKPSTCVCDCVWDIVFIHSSVDGFSGCLHILSIINIAMNIGVQAYFQIFNFFWYIPRMDLPNHMAVLVLVFWDTSISLFIVATPIYTHTNSVWKFFFLHILSICCL